MEKASMDSYVVIVYVPMDDDLDDKRNFGILGIGKTIEDALYFFKNEKDIGYGSRVGEEFTLLEIWDFGKTINELAVKNGNLYFKPTQIDLPDVRALNCSKKTYDYLLTIKKEFFLNSGDVSYNYNYAIRGDFLARDKDWDVLDINKKRGECV